MNVPIMASLSSQPGVPSWAAHPKSLRTAFGYLEQELDLRRTFTGLMSQCRIVHQVVERVAGSQGSMP